MGNNASVDTPGKARPVSRQGKGKGRKLEDRLDPPLNSADGPDRVLKSDGLDMAFKSDSPLLNSADGPDRVSKHDVLDMALKSDGLDKALKRKDTTTLAAAKCQFQRVRSAAGKIEPFKEKTPERVSSVSDKLSDQSVRSSKKDFELVSSNSSGKRTEPERTANGEISVGVTNRFKISWPATPSNILIISKIHDPGAAKLVAEIARWLVREKMVNIILEPAMTKQIPEFRDNDWDKDGLFKIVDMVICLGGDGTMLYACSLFQDGVPPMMCFHMGSLGFLMNFDISTYKDSISKALSGECWIALRRRLFCQISRGGAPANENDTFTVLNEAVLGRGSSPFLSNLELYLDGERCSSIQADGVIIATPSGSTAYSLSAGGSMIHPAVPGILFTPICPHVLSSRPIVFPDYVEIKLKVPPDSRGTAWASFDGRNDLELKPSDSLIITMSPFPLPTFCSSTETQDWIHGLAQCLHWNERKRQGALNTH